MCRGRAAAFCVTVLALILACAAPVLAEPSADFDPHPAADDLVLPMPNGARMVFRPVFLGVGDGVLAERAYVMGDSSGANFREKPVQVSVGGSFVKENGKRKDWLFYLGKYEVTRAQYQAVGAQTGKRERTPQTGLTRGEVERFIETYNTWLRKVSPGALPEQGGSPGFLRLPSEEEWEFAARGGVAVNAERFQKATPYEGELAKHEWFGGQRSSFGKLKEVGLLAPNPLQIYDLLGNAAEMTRSPYTLEFGRGRIGGFTVRGGSFRTAEGDMRASLRTEQLVMGTDGQPPKDESVGFRLAIGSAVFANLASSRALEDATADPLTIKPAVPPMKMPPQATPVAKPQEVPSAIEQQLRALQEEVTKLKSAVGTPPTPAPPPSPAATSAPPMELAKLVPPVLQHAPAPDVSGAATLQNATMNRPFINTLGMKYVPVPVEAGQLGRKVLFSIWETRVQDYNVFVKATGRAWEKPPFVQGPTHPAVRVSWDDATAFCEWLTKREHDSGKLPTDARYRLPTDLEWSWAVGIEVEYGDTPAMRDSVAPGYPWGDAWPPPRGAGNYDVSLHTDTFTYTSPVGSFKPNRYGLYDLGGNAFEWVADYFDQTETSRTVRGASWADVADSVMSSFRNDSKPDVHFKSYGFRCVLAPLTEVANPKSALVAPQTTVSPPSPTAAPASPIDVAKLVPPVPRLLPVPDAGGATTLQNATMKQPFINTLGMKFVPVPGTPVLFSIWETRVQDYGAFAKSTGTTIKKPQFAGNFHQSATDPIVQVSWTESKAFCLWLTHTERQRGLIKGTEEYRLPTDHEWSCAVGIGDHEDPNESPRSKADKLEGIFPWGNVWPPPPKSGNFAGEEGGKIISQGIVCYIENYNDGFKFTAPVGSFSPNHLGIYDMEGNVSEWCADQYDQKNKVMRGGNFQTGYYAGYLKSSAREGINAGYRVEFYGFRCVLAPVAAARR